MKPEELKQTPETIGPSLPSETIHKIEMATVEFNDAYARALLETMGTDPEFNNLNVGRAMQTLSLIGMRINPEQSEFLIPHSLGVGRRLAKYPPMKSELIQAGLLHEILIYSEVHGYTAFKLRGDFGDKVFKIVSEVMHLERTKLTEAGFPWTEKKLIYLKKLRKASRDAQMLVCADHSDTLWWQIEKYKVEGIGFWDGIKTTLDQELWLHEQILKTLMDKKLINYRMLADFEELLTQAKFLFGYLTIWVFPDKAPKVVRELTALGVPLIMFGKEKTERGPIKLHLERGAVPDLVERVVEIGNKTGAIIRIDQRPESELNNHQH